MNKMPESEKPKFPKRAPTRFWMSLNFAIFVGLGTSGVILYTVIGLSNDIFDSARESHIVDTEHIASLIHSTDLITTDPSAWDEILTPEIGTLLDFQDLFICIARGDSIVWRNDPLEDIAHHQIMLHYTTEENPYFDILPREDENLIQLGAVRDGDIVIGMVRPVSPLYLLISRIQKKVILGFGFTLFMAMVGAWVASVKVTRPLRNIKRATNRIVAGEYDTPITVTSRAAEFQDLESNVSYMSKKYMEKIQELENVTKMQRDFISNISHEVRNPIFAISGFLEALGSSKLSMKQRQQYSEKGLLNLRRLNNLFSSLIEIARMENRDHALRFSPTNLAVIANDTKELFFQLAQDKGLRLEFDVNDAWVCINHIQIERVFVNLIENAIQYSTSGTITCRFHKFPNKYRVEIIDQGRGIPADQLSLIFERFHRVDNARSRHEGGTGLGLAIVKQILQDHGTSVHVESTLGQGSCFWFELPQAKLDSKSSPKPSDTD